MPARQSFNGGGDSQNFLRADGGTERQKERIVALAPPNPYAGDKKELPII